MASHEFLIFSCFAALVALVTHGFIRRYWVGVLVAAIACSLTNLLFVIVAIALKDFELAFRGANIAFWFPMELMTGFIYSLPAVAIVGMPFVVARFGMVPDAEEA